MKDGHPADAAPPDLEQIRARLRPFFHARNVHKAIVFGSWARGTNTRRSDLDLAIVLDTRRTFLERWQDLRGIEEIVPGVHPEMLIYAPGEIEAISHRSFIRRMLAEGITIYER